jgi:hypothetical protein
MSVKLEVDITMGNQTTREIAQVHAEGENAATFALLTALIAENKDKMLEGLAVAASWVAAQADEGERRALEARIKARAERYFRGGPAEVFAAIKRGEFGPLNPNPMSFEDAEAMQRAHSTPHGVN